MSERWRGITFAARELRLRTSSPLPYTAYWLTAAFPDHISWYPSLLQYSITVVRLDVPYGRTIETKDALAQAWPKGVEVTENVTLERVDVAAIVVQGPLQIAVSGPVPLIAYLPVENSTIALSQRQSTFPTEPATASLHEEYTSAARLRKEHETLYATLAYPTVDVVSTALVLTIDDPTATLIAGDYRKEVNSGTRSGWTRETILIVKPPFSTRIAALPLGQEGLADALRGSVGPAAQSSASQLVVAEPERGSKGVDASAPIASEDELKGSYTRFKEPEKPARPLAPGEEVRSVSGHWTQPTIVVPRPAGVTDLTVSKPLSSSEYSALNRELQARDRVEAPEIRSSAAELDRSGLEFRYPVVPPVNGFDIFGLLDQLKLSVTSGHLMIGGTALTVDAPSVLEFRHIRALTTTGNVVPIPLVGGGAAQALAFHLKATSQLYLNGEHVVVRPEMIRTLIDLTTSGSNIVAAVCGVVTLWLAIRLRRRSRT
jgi:hypothetical protein